MFMNETPYEYYRSLEERSCAQCSDLIGKYRKVFVVGLSAAILVLVIIICAVAVPSTGEDEQCKRFGNEATMCKISATRAQFLRKEGNLSTEVALEEKWIVIQRRGQYGNREDYFYKNFAEYKAGFGEVSGELWLGLDLLNQLTSEGDWMLEVELIDWGNETYRAQYKSFVVEAPPMYTLRVDGYNHTGESTAGDSLSVNHRPDWKHSGMAFSTKDNEQDKYGSYRHCAQTYTGAWWYNKCHASNLNGWNFPQRTEEWKGMTWYYGGGRGDTKASWMGSVMKIRKK